MLDLRDLIIERIGDAAAFSQNILIKSSSLEQSLSLDFELKVNRSILKSLTKAKKRQKQRKEMEQRLMQETKSLQLWQSSVLQNFYSVCQAILLRYDSSFLSVLESIDSTAAKLSKLYDLFLTKESTRIAGNTLLNSFINSITNISPALILPLISEWSRTLFMEKLQTAMNAQFDRHQIQMKQISALRSNIVLAHHEKVYNPLSFSTHIQRSNESRSLPILTNKQSIYGLFLDEMTQYYRNLPLELELDFSFIKNIRKIHIKGNQFEKEDNLQKAAEILMEAKNKTIKDQIQAYKRFYLQKYPTCLQDSAKPTASRSPRKAKCTKKSTSDRNSHGIQRIKSESREEQFGQSQQLGEMNRNSLLLCRKFKQISFDSAELFKKKAKRRVEKQQFELPELINHRLAANHSKSTTTRSKPIHLVSISKNIVLDQISPKNYDFKEPCLIDKLLRKNNYSMNKQTRIQEENPEKLTRRGDPDELKRNRKLMLQLLREKNRNSLFE